MSKPTLGPWHVYLDEPYDKDRPTYFLEDHANHQLMLLARLPEASEAEHKANCELIGKAWTMREALKKIAVGDTEVHDEELGCAVSVAMDEDEMQSIAQAALEAHPSLKESTT